MAPLTVAITLDPEGQLSTTALSQQQPLADMLQAILCALSVDQQLLRLTVTESRVEGLDHQGVFGDD